MDLGRVREHSRVTILEQRVVIPGAFPQLVQHVYIFVGQRVAVIVREQPFMAEVAPAVLQRAGDDVPGDATVGGVIERRDPPCESERRLLYRTGAERDPEVLRDGRQRRDEHHRIVAGKLHPQPRVQVVPTLVVAIQADQVGEEDGVEAAGIQALGEIHPEVEIVVVDLPAVRVAPETMHDVRRRVHDERREAHRLAIVTPGHTRTG